LALIITILMQFLGPVLYRTLPNHTNRLFFVHWMTYLALGIFACMFFYILTADVVVGLAVWVFHLDDIAATQALVVGVLILVSVIVGGIQLAIGPSVYEVDIPLENLPPAFDAFRIVQISDLHLGPTIGARYAKRCVEIANRLDADVIVLTGDFVDGSVEQLREAVDPLFRLKAKQGVFFITGNHEYYWGVDEWLHKFRNLGARVLLNEHVVLRKDGSSLVLAGLPDRTGASMPEHAPDLEQALRDAPPDAVKILLAHHPKNCFAAAKAGFHLQLSGHTHGGQFFPFSLVVRLFEKYYKGLYRVGGLWLYVNRGTGYWGPPLRFGVPSEITLVRLRRIALT
jgi:predicted MPP superfamily phosphohydrolase